MDAVKVIFFTILRTFQLNKKKDKIFKNTPALSQENRINYVLQLCKVSKIFISLFLIVKKNNSKIQFITKKRQKNYCWLNLLKY